LFSKAAVSDTRQKALGPFQYQLTFCKALSRGLVSAQSHNVTVDGGNQWDRRSAQHVNGNQGKNLCASKAKQTIMLALRPISSMIFHKRL